MANSVNVNNNVSLRIFLMLICNTKYIFLMLIYITKYINIPHVSLYK